jgi:protein-L-isoaspartate(D-aspartate) O-methyltransferase
VLRVPSRGEDHRRELGLLLGSRLMRAAEQDWYEQGDIWAHVAAHRSGDDNPPEGPSHAAVRQLITTDTDREHSPLQAAPAWPAAFKRAGQKLAELAHQGTLTRGLRAVLAHHILFAWNRAGIPGPQQALLAATASQVVFYQQSVGPHQFPAAPFPSLIRVTPVTTTDSIQTATPDPERMQVLIDSLHRFGMIHNPRVEAAFRAVPRHVFLPGLDLDTAYAPQVVVTKRAADGSAVSSASHPHVVGAMLEQLDVRPGQSVLEIGAATGINAALLAELVGPTGKVVTVEIDQELATGARAALTAAGYPQVEVICGDGAQGHASGAPYDRIIVTAGAWDLAPAWWAQLAAEGRLVVPLRLHGSDLTRSIAFDNRTDRLVSASAQVCGFVPLVGATAYAGHTLRLADDVTLRLPAGSPDEEALRQALAYGAHEQWTGVVVDDDQPIEHLDLWLATTARSGFVRLFAGPQARENGVADPARRWAGAAIHNGGTLAYITRRELDDDKGELGVTAHGPDSQRLAEELAEHLHIWDRQRPTQPLIIAHPAGTPDDRLSPEHRIEKPSARLTISW